MAATQDSADRLSVAAVIITRNRRETLALVIDRLRAEPVDEILVVDNGSTDGTAELVEGYGAPVRLLEPGENLGLGGRNLAAKEATEALLLMLDDDCYPLPGAVETLADAFRANPRLGAAGGFVRDVDPEGRILRQTELGTFDWWLRAGQEGDAPREGFQAFFFPEGASMLRKAAYDEVDGYFEPFFHGSEALDLATRLIGAGWDVRYVPSAAFDHLKAESERQTSGSNLYYRIRNHLLYIWMRFPTSLAVRRTVGYLSFDLVEATYRGVPGAWAKAVRDAWHRRELVREKRDPLPREALRRAELNRGRMHVRLLAGQLARRLRFDR